MTRRRPSLLLLSLIGVVIAMLMSPLTTSFSARLLYDSPKGFFVFACSSLLTGADINDTVAAVYAHTPGSKNWPAKSQIESVTLTMFNSVCGQSAFQTLAQGWGSGNFSLEFFGLDSASGIRLSNFTFSWEKWQSTGLSPSSDLLSFSEWWAGDVSSGGISGPFTTTPYRSMINGLNANHTWSGYEWFAPGTAPPVLVNESAYPTIVSFSAPTCSIPPCQVHVPSGTTIDPVGVVFTGLSTQTGRTGSGKLLQTGYVYDQTNPTAGWCTAVNSSCDFTFYWEITGHHAVAYTGGPRGFVGDVLIEEVYPGTLICTSGGSRWITEIVDLTTGLHWTHPICLTEFQPRYAPMIYDAPKLKVAGSNWYQQTPRFQTIEFQSAYLSTSSAIYSTTDLMCPCPPGAGTYDVYQMKEHPSYFNTLESYSGYRFPCGVQYLPWVGNSCQDTQWQTSAYDFAYV